MNKIQKISSEKEEIRIHQILKDKSNHFFPGNSMNDPFPLHLISFTIDDDKKIQSCNCVNTNKKVYHHRQKTSSLSIGKIRLKQCTGLAPTCFYRIMKNNSINHLKSSDLELAISFFRFQSEYNIKKKMLYRWITALMDVYARKMEESSCSSEESSFESDQF